MIADVRAMREERDITVQRILRQYKVRRALERYEKFVSISAYHFAWGNHADREDFEQEGREAIWRAVMSLEAKQDKGTHQYFRVAIRRAMIDYTRKLRRRNYQVWEYTGPPPRVHKVRYRSKVKTKIQYFGDKLTRVAYQYESPLNYDDLFSETDT
jgi:hypothetical protein